MEMLVFTRSQKITGNLPGLKQLSRFPREFTESRQTKKTLDAQKRYISKGFQMNLPNPRRAESTYQAPEDSSKGKVGIELLADAARPVHLLARYLLDEVVGVGDHLPGH